MAAELTEYSIVIVHGITFLTQVAKGDKPVHGRHS